MYLTIRGIILRVTDYGEHDALLTVLSSRYGKLALKARGLRRKNSPLTGVCQLLSYGEFVLFEKHGQYLINEAHIINLFEPLRKDLSLLSLASYFAQVTEVLSQEDYPTPELQSLLLNCLFALSDMHENEAKVKAVFEFRAACLAGYTPELTGCHVCGNQSPDRFDLSSGLLECHTCRSDISGGIRVPVVAGLLDALRYICFCNPKRLFSFSLPPDILMDLSAVTEAYLCTQLERSFSALTYYKTLAVGPYF